MAATDQPYRSQRILDIVFAVSCVVMLLSVVVMFAQDYYRPFKVQQREFRDVETTVFERAMLEQLPDDKTLQAVEEADSDLTKARDELAKTAVTIERDLRSLQAQRVRLEAELQSLKATYDSLVSLRNIDVDNGNNEGAKDKETQLDALKRQIDSTQDQIDSNRVRMNEVQTPVRETEATLAQGVYQKMIDSGMAAPIDVREVKTLSQCEDPIKKATSDFDRMAKTAAQKNWKFGDWFRALPVIDGFASPYRIEQYTLDALPIDYNFKQVTRYDRCHTCHMGIGRANFDRETLTRLKDAPEGAQSRLQTALAMLGARKKRGETLGFDPSDLPSRASNLALTPAQITQYSAHPRLDLFVDSNSPHSAEKFGCTICHSGQGSATEFDLAAHSPNNAVQREQWMEEHGWHASHFWDFPMLSHRFVESSCVKCHHEMTDLIRQGSRDEAPKLLRGYNLVRENGCFGCHEIAGIKGGRPVGPDLRLEPNPPLEEMTPAEQTKMLSDPLNPPGKMRKVGPSLYRLAEKTNEDWVRKWVQDPRGFRPDTRMPHFYGLSNNKSDELPDGQEQFPAAEIHAIAYYLFRESRGYLKGEDKYRRDNMVRRQRLEEKEKNNTISERERKELEEVRRRLELAGVPQPLLQMVKENGKEVERLHVIDGESNLVPSIPTVANDQQRIEGARLFREKGCLACHQHEGTAQPLKDERGVIPAVVSQADFGPNLSRLAAKIRPAAANPADEEKARRTWLVQWIMNPNVHFPRTRMPITHLSVDEAARIADWLLSQPADWAEPQVPAPGSETLAALARVYLSKSPGLTREDVEKFLREGIPQARLETMAYDADEHELQSPVTDDKLAWYIGRKAINRLGCFACHNIPGFEFTKPIGTPLNDWGKKDTERLAFEDIAAFVEKHYNVVPLRDDPNDRSKAAADWDYKGGKAPYEDFYYELLAHHQHDQTGRIGFLNQKLVEPRSYDYNRERTWDDRLRMPQFKFAHTHRLPDESDEAYKARAAREEAEAREAVMTFILGLVAEPVPLSYLNKPAGDRLAEVKGRHVLDKFNCAGCHQVRSGIYEFKMTPEVQRQLEDSYTAAMSSRGKSDHVFPDDDAWVGPAQPSPSRLLVHGIPDRASEDKLLAYWLTEAVRFTNGEKKPVNIPAGEIAELPAKDLLAIPMARSEPYGGAFVDLMRPYAETRGIPIISAGGAKTDFRWARASLPPPLIREGERVQPDWLYQFLRNPTVIRPQQRGTEGVMFLRMPRFNMSAEEAQALVNYFGAADRLSNPGIGLTYPYLSIPQREEGYWRERTKEYAKQLGPKQLEEKANGLTPLWLEYLQDQVTEMERKLKAAEESVKAAQDIMNKSPDAKKKEAQDALAIATKSRDTHAEEVKKLRTQVEKKDVTELRRQWDQSGVYATDAYRLLSVKGPCMSCHQVQGAGDTKAPPLDLSHARLRPEWTLRWLANPRRLYAYDTPMLQNFENNKRIYQDLFEGPSIEQARAARDLLMNFPKEVALPTNRYYRMTPGGN